MAVASAGLYASLHLIPDNHANIPPLSVKALKAAEIIRRENSSLMNTIANSKTIRYNTVPIDTHFLVTKPKC